MIGGILVATSVAGVLVAHRAASAPPATRYVVAAREITAGQVLRREDLGLLAVDLPEGVGSVPAGAAADLVGRVAARDVDELDLLRPTDVRVGPVTPPGAVEVTIELDPTRTPDDLRPGQQVTVLATDPSGGTDVLARGATVAAVDELVEGGIGGRDGVRVRLAAGGESEATALVDAAVARELTVVVPTDGGGDSDG